MYTNYSDNRYKRKKEKKKQTVKIFKEICMQDRNPRKASTMACRFLETSLPSSQKGKTSHFSPTRKQAPYSHLSLKPARSSHSSTNSAPTLSIRAPSSSQPGEESEVGRGAFREARSRGSRDKVLSATIHGYGSSAEALSSRFELAE